MLVERVGTQLEDGEKGLPTLVARGRISEGRESRCQPVTSNYPDPGAFGFLTMKSIKPRPNNGNSRHCMQLGGRIPISMG